MTTPGQGPDPEPVEDIGAEPSPAASEDAPDVYPGEPGEPAEQADAEAPANEAEAPGGTPSRPLWG